MFPEILYDTPELKLSIVRDNNIIRITEPYNHTEIEVCPEKPANGGGLYIKGMRKMYPTFWPDGRTKPAIKVL